MATKSNINTTGDVTLHWFLPSNGDSRGIVGGGHGAGPEVGDRAATLDYLRQVAQAAERNGIEALLTPTSTWCNDAWVTGSALIESTKKIKFLLAVRPGLNSPTAIAQQAQAFQEYSEGRLLINVVVGGEDAEQRTYGDFTTKEERYAIADEVLQITDHLWSSSEPLNFRGKYRQVEDARLSRLPDTPPGIFFSGSSPAAIEIAARRAEVYVTWGEHPDDVKEKLDRVRRRAQELDRSLEYALRLHVISRDTEGEAWAEAQRLLDGIDPDAVRAAQAGMATSQSEGQRRMSLVYQRGASFEQGISARRFEISPNLWSGIGLVRGGAGTALVGSHDQVAERIEEYRDSGISQFILSGFPHLEEVYRLGDSVVPALQRRGLSVTNFPESARSVQAV